MKKMFSNEKMFWEFFFGQRNTGILKKGLLGLSELDSVGKLTIKPKNWIWEQKEGVDWNQKIYLNGKHSDLVFFTWASFFAFEF